MSEYRPNTAFESITSRSAWYTSEAIEKYRAVQWGTDGRLALADGSQPVAGIVEYGTENADELATFVTGTYPVTANGAITTGDKISFSAGKATKASGTAYGIALNDANADEIVSVALFAVPAV